MSRIKANWFPVRAEDIKYFQGLDTSEIANVFFALLSDVNGADVTDNLSNTERIVYEIICEHIEQDLADME